VHKLASVLIVIGAALAGSITNQAHAQATRTWVSGVGDDANPCGRTTPCKTFAGAISRTTIGGEINCTDSGGFGAITITKAITISCEGVIAGIVVSGTNGVVVNAPGAVVVLHGLDIDGAGTGLSGINIIAASAVQVHRTSIRNFNAGNNNGWGINVAPTAATRMDVTDSIISNNGSASTGGGIRIRPTGTGTVTGAISQVKVLNNAGTGVVVDGSAATGPQMILAVRDSVVIGNVVMGILSNTGAANTLVRVAIDRTSVVGSATGVASTGNGDITIGSSLVTGNSIGVKFTAPATLRTYKTNQMRGNIVDNGTFSDIIPLE
jgi:hypothetical protein